MGYYSSIVNFKQEPFVAIPGVTAAKLKRALDDCGTGFGDTFDYWFTVEIDGENQLTLEYAGEGGKAYDLDEIMDALVDILIPLEADPGPNPGFRFSYELWGEEPGDAVLYISNGTQLFRIDGEIQFTGKEIPVRS